MPQEPPVWRIERNGAVREDAPGYFVTTAELPEAAVGDTDVGEDVHRDDGDHEPAQHAVGPRPPAPPLPPPRHGRAHERSRRSGGNRLVE